MRVVSLEIAATPLGKTFTWSRLIFWSSLSSCSLGLWVDVVVVGVVGIGSGVGARLGVGFGVWEGVGALAYEMLCLMIGVTIL